MIEGDALRIAGFENDFGFWAEILIPDFSLVAETELAE
jgi:hypothetical protein